MGKTGFRSCSRNACHDGYWLVFKQNHRRGVLLLFLMLVVSSDIIIAKATPEAYFRTIWSAQNGMECEFPLKSIRQWWLLASVCIVHGAFFLCSILIKPVSSLRHWQCSRIVHPDGPWWRVKCGLIGVWNLTWNWGCYHKELSSFVAICACTEAHSCVAAVFFMFVYLSYCSKNEGRLVYWYIPCWPPVALGGQWNSCPNGPKVECLALSSFATCGSRYAVLEI